MLTSYPTPPASTIAWLGCFSISTPRSSAIISSFHLHHEDGLIVERHRVESVQFSEDPDDQIIGRHPAMFSYHVCQAAAAEFVTGGAHVIADAIRVQNDHIARLGLKRDLFVVGALQQTDRYAFYADLQDFPTPADHRRQSTCIGDHELPRR